MIDSDVDYRLWQQAEKRRDRTPRVLRVKMKIIYESEGKRYCTILLSNTMTGVIELCDDTMKRRGGRLISTEFI